MRNWHRQLDMSGALSANNGPGHFHSALVTNNPFIAYFFVFSAITLPVFGRSEDFFAKKAVAFIALGAIIYSFRLGYLAVRPVQYIIGTGQAQADRIKIGYSSNGRLIHIAKII